MSYLWHFIREKNGCCRTVLIVLLLLEEKKHCQTVVVACFTSKDTYGNIGVKAVVWDRSVSFPATPAHLTGTHTSDQKGAGGNDCCKSLQYAEFSWRN